MIRQGNQAMMSPFHDLIIEAGDIVVIAASKIPSPVCCRETPIY